MCGITGIFNFENDRLVNSSTLSKMTDVLSHRGPDGSGIFLDGNLGFGHRRLSIIDLELGNQPMLSHDKSLVITYNGEIFNYLELRSELSFKGHKFFTNSDTEVIINAYKEWGFDCQSRFNGMWAFGLFDINKRILFLSRDRYGEKPLYYSTNGERFIFASEIKSLLEGGVKKDIRFEALELYLFLDFVPYQHSFFKDIHQLEPGQFLKIENGKIETKYYYQFPDIDEDNMLQDRSIVEKRFEELFYDSVRLRTRSDVPYGAFLSGGLDSSSIVSVMSQINSDQVKCFTLGNDLKSYDETYEASLVVKKNNALHFVSKSDSRDVLQGIHRIVQVYDEPFADSSAIPVDIVSKLASDRVKVVLTGDGGDEVLSGYTSYQSMLSTQMYNKYLPNFADQIFVKLLSGVGMVSPVHYRYKLNKYVRTLNEIRKPLEELLVSKMTTTTTLNMKKLIMNVQGIRPIEDFMSEVFKNCNLSDPFYKYNYFINKIALPIDSLVKVDRMSMANSLETRQPFLDYRLFDLMYTVDKKIKFYKGIRKSVLKNTLGKILPRELLNLREKGFSIPITYWLNNKKYFDKLQDGVIKKLGLDINIFNLLTDEYSSKKKDHSRIIFKLLVLDKFLENYL